MRLPTEIKGYLSDEELCNWARAACSAEGYRRRLAIWMTHDGKLHAHRVARLLCVSVASVWRWIARYNALGPDRFDYASSGGRLRALLSWAEEEEVLEQWNQCAQQGQVITVKDLHASLCERMGHEVSLPYVYKLLKRHQWRKIAPRPRHTKADPAAQEAYKKTPRVGGGHNC